MCISSGRIPEGNLIFLWQGARPSFDLVKVADLVVSVFEIVAVGVVTRNGSWGWSGDWSVTFLGSGGWIPILLLRISKTHCVLLRGKEEGRDEFLTFCRRCIALKCTGPQSTGVENMRKSMFTKWWCCFTLSLCSGKAHPSFGIGQNWLEQAIYACNLRLMSSFSSSVLKKG